MTAIPAGRVRRAAALFVIGVTALTALMPPGLCACWINPTVADVHIHLGAPSANHSHEYLSDSADVVAAIAVFLPQPDLLSLILVALMGAIWTVFTQPPGHGKSWTRTPGPPPPRAAFSGT